MSIFIAVLSAGQASADHDMVYAPCDPADTRPLNEQVWYQNYQNGTALRYDDPWWGEKPGSGGYTNWEHQCRLGQTGVWQAAPIPPLVHRPDHEVETRQTKSPCIRELETTVDRLIAEGAIASTNITVTDHGVFLYVTSPIPLVEAGVVMEWALGRDGYGRHYQDTYWEYMFDGVSNWTFWQIRCDPNITTTTTTTQPAVEDPAPEPIPSIPEEPDPSPQPPPEEESEAAPTTTIAIVPTTTTVAPIEENPECGLCDLVESVTVPDAAQDGSYTLFDAEWDGYPFEQTILLLEERYPPGTPGKYHFRLSAAVEYLRLGGMVKGLDNLWNTSTE